MIIRSNKEKWTTVDNMWVKDIALSAKAKGILLYILSLPNDWDLHVTELVTHFIDGEKSIRSGMKELTDRGYMFCIPRKDSSNIKFIGNDYVIMENPQAELRDAENRDALNDPLLNTKEKLSTNKTKLFATDEQLQIIAHLNKRLGLVTPRGFKDTNQQTLKLLNARLKDYTKKDIIAVIDMMCNKRMGTEWQMYLRPITLFNTNKFEGYVNSITVEGSEEREHAVMPLQDLE